MKSNVTSTDETSTDETAVKWFKLRFEPREIELPEAIVQEEHPSSEQGPAAPQLETNIPKPVRKSGRNRKSPDWFMNYVPA